MVDEPVPTRDIVRDLQRALDSRVVIEQAKGIIAARRNLPVVAAFEELRGAARRRRVGIDVVAGEVVDAHHRAVDGGAEMPVTPS